jgi:ABC-type Fe3+-hydroxamate transport system substrate-binding protein
MNIITKSLIISLGLGMSFTGCVQNSKQFILENNQSVKIRSYQVRTYYEKKKDVARSVVSTLQDLSFIIDKVDMRSGTVTATKFIKDAAMRVSIIIRETEDGLTKVRINMSFSSGNSLPETVTNPQTYKSFFTSLDKSLFLEQEDL